jgi:hypothetical protein
MSEQLSPCPFCGGKPTLTVRADHVPDAGKMVDEAAMAKLTENGRKAWAFLGDRSASDWVDEIRGNSQAVSEAQLWDEIARLRFDLENATESRKLAQQALYDARERFQKEVSARTSEISRLLKERQDCEPWGWAIVDKNGDDIRARVRLVNFFGAVNHQQEPLTKEDVAQADSEWAGLAPCRLVTLYAAPPKREPFSDAQIVRIHSALQHGPDDTPWSWDFKQGFRAAEKAHGIGGQS